MRVYKVKLIGFFLLVSLLFLLFLVSSFSVLQEIAEKSGAELYVENREAGACFIISLHTPTAA